jgi:hypothetical protein
MGIPDFEHIYKQSRELGNPIDATRKFLHLFVIDNEFSDMQNEIKEFVEKDSEKALKYLLAIEELASDSQLTVGLLADLVEFDGGKPLDEPKDENARSYLRELVYLIQRFVAAGNLST